MTSSGETFDLVTLIEVLEHIPHDLCSQFLRCLGNLVNPGGALILTVPHKNQKMPRKHYRHFCTSELVTLLDKELPNFEVTEAYGFGKKIG